MTVYQMGLSSNMFDSREGEDNEEGYKWHFQYRYNHITFNKKEWSSAFYDLLDSDVFCLVRVNFKPKQNTERTQILGHPDPIGHK